MGFVNALWKFFGSLQLTASLIALLMIGSFAGMFIDQTVSYETHMAAMADAPLQARLFTLLELHNLFGSWWFMGLVLLLALNLIDCTLERLPRVWREVFQADPALSEERLREFKNGVELEVDGLDRALESARMLLTKVAGKAVILERNGGTLLFAERQRTARFAAIIIHTSLLMIMFGHVGNTLFGVDASIAIPEGSASSTLFVRGPAGLTKRSPLGFEVACDDFRAETFKSGRPMDFESDLVVRDEGQARQSKTIRVNDPLEYGGLTFYQSSYQPLPGEERVRLLAGPRGGELKPLRLGVGERAVMGDGVAITPIEVLEDLSGFGEALRLLKVDADGQSQTLQLFKQFPDMDARMRKGALEFRLVEIERRFATILSVSRSPLASVVFIGFALMVLGAGFALTLSHRRYWVLVKRGDGDRCTLFFAGVARRHQQAFATEHRRLTGELRSSLGLAPAARAKREKR